MNATLNMILMQTTPTKSVRRLQVLFWVTLPTLKRMYPASKLPSAHRTFTVGDDNPLPGGFENGDGKASPDMP
jgi:hypothetical protein